MSQIFSELDALVLRATPYGDNSAYLLVLSRQHGKVMLRARGARRRKSPLLAFVEPLVYARFSVFDYRERLTINDAEAHSFFVPLRSDVRKLALATYMADVADVVADGDRQDDALLRLMLTALHKLSGTQYTLEHIKAVFEWRIAAIAGYQLEAPQGLSSDRVKAIHHSQTAPTERAFSFVVSDDDWRDEAEDYLQTHLAHAFESLVFYKRLS
ncbi:MAG: DNA repair protein RecO [Oscillospiraceae bacterium]|nr:DNA repair protein RecO [Oscillospiraceae bacterium]